MAATSCRVDAVLMTETWKVSTGLLDQASAEALAGRIECMLDLEGAVVAAYETEPDSGDWAVDVYFGVVKPDEHEVARLFDGQAVTVEKLPEVDWVSRSQSLLKPIRAGRFYVHGQHDRHTRPSGAICIEMQAGQAFGTGHHGTTQGCLLAIDHVLRREKQLERRVLDLGCGSAILAIAYALAAKRPVIASDIDPVAIATARGNAQLNQASALVETFVAAGMRDRRLSGIQQFDLLIANILAGPLQRMKPEIARALAPEGQLILSGITVDQEARLLGSYRPFGLTLQRRWRLEGWSTLLLS